MTFSQTIIRWYHKNKRDLPWRHTNDPYKIWISEIILQQTRVAQGLPYYNRFIEQFPRIQILANAKEELVIKTWQGLGYYSRARNLHSTAIFISKTLKGKFPDSFEEIKSLKGIGDYTAAAIASFAFNKVYPVVDGNVFRVLSRYFGSHTPIDSMQGKKEFLAIAEKLIDKKTPGIFNQAIMEFGAMQCLPQNPLCNNCPLKKSCKALIRNQVNELPVKSHKTKTKNRYFNYFVIIQKGKLLIRKRTGKDIWENLYDFPLIETSKKASLKAVAKTALIKNTSQITSSASYRHVLSHQIIHAEFWILSGETTPVSFLNMPNHYFVSSTQLKKYPFPRLLEQYLNKNKNELFL